eukprot:TRINITY_DN14216_c0_g1_i1.p1 TRINITY_DN14216_c0_g1~~TRINITY_DN14216_c0_g1_i1.p1  ORF type:complete len:525 (+),score=55.19 TRINITY_DN14216_c0_g1_i1:88-1662(+)
MLRTSVSCVILLCAACLGEDEIWVGKAPVREYHYSVKIKGSVAGVMSLKLYRDDDRGVYKSVEEMEAEVDRGNDKVTLRFRTDIEEDGEGKVLRAGYKQKMATQEIEMKYDYVGNPNAVSVSSIQGGQTHHSEAPLPKPHVGRIGMLRKIEESLTSAASKGTQLTFRTMKPEMGPAAVDVETTITSIESEPISGLESTAIDVLVSKWATRVTGISLQSTEWYYLDRKDDGMPAAVMVHYSVDSPLGKLESNLQLESAAKEAMLNEEKKPELVHSAFITLPGIVKRLWNGEGKVSYRVTTKTGERAEIPSEGYQTAAPDGDAMVVTVDLGRPERVSIEEVMKGQYLTSTAMIDGGDSEVKKLARKVVKRAGEVYYGPPSPQMLVRGAWAETKKAIKLSNLATGFASASETARTKTGDCSEHAVLLAAILRALGVPSRACSGLVYLEERGGKGHFGWHMWTQAALPASTNDEGAMEWHDVDATLPIPFSLGHILLGTSAMTDIEAHTAELKLVSLIGNLQVDVIDP